MKVDFNEFFSSSAKGMKPSPIRALLGVVNQPGVISFAGGFPNPATFPIEDLKTIMMEVLEEEGAKALQYGGTDGNAALREELAKRYVKEGLDIDKDNIIITTASQQAIDLTAKVLLDPGDIVICGLPSYIGALQAFGTYQAKMVGAEKDEELEAVVRAMCLAGKKPKFIYAIPDFQNPTGITMTIEQREYMVRIARKYDILILEDSPYKEIRFEGEHLPYIYTMAPERTILLGTFSKTFAPGFRLGWIVAPKEFINKINIAKQSADLCSPTFDQAVAARYLKKGLFEKNIAGTVKMYKGKRDLILKAFEEYMPEGVTWTRPDGGLFLLVKLPEWFDARDLFEVALKKNVAFVIGEAFFCDGSGKNTFRVNYSFMDDESIVEGVRRLASAIEEFMRK